MESIRIVRNAHHILGLPTGCDLSEIKKRANHLLNLARIDETETYDTDLPGISNLRSEENIKKSLERLTSVKTRLLESFFWFETPTLQDHRALKELTKGNIEFAVSYWKGLSVSSPNWVAKKNEALALFIHAYQTSDVQSLEKSLLVWRDLGSSEQFWTFYEAHYKLSDDLGTSNFSFSELRLKLFDYMSWLVLDIYRKNHNPEMVKVFFSHTGIVGKGIEDHVLGPLIVNIQQDLKKLESEPTDSLRIRTAMMSLHQSLDELSRFGCDNYSPVKALRETCASNLRSTSIAVHNESSDINLAKDLLSKGASLSTSESYLQQVEKDKAQLIHNEEFSKFIDDLTEEGKYFSPAEKWFAFKRKQSALSDRVRSGEAVNELRRKVFCQYAVDTFVYHRKQVQDGNEDAGASGLNILYAELVENLSLFDFNEEKVRGFAEECLKRAKSISSPEQISTIDNDIEEIQGIADKSKLDEESKLIFLVVCQTASWKEGAPYLQRLRYARYLDRVGSYTWFIYGIGFLFFIASYCYRRKMF